jgi:sugar lactone lactonase YvrE
VAASRYERAAPVEPRPAAGWTLETVVAPAPFYGANGIKIGPDGRCWIAEFRGGSVSAWDAETGEITTEVAGGGVIAGPDDIAFGPDGTLYLTEYGIGGVDCLRPDGGHVVLLDDAPSANGITVDSEGRLYVDEFRPGGRLLELYPAEPGRHRVIADLEFPNALERGPDGRLYLQNVIAGIVYSIDPDRGDLVQVADGFSMPAAVKITPDGGVAVAEHGTGDVYRVDPATGARELLASTLPGVDNVCFDGAGRLYVSSAAHGEVLRFPRGSREPDRRTDPGLAGPYGLAELPGGEILIADMLRVASVPPSGGRPRTLWQLRPPERPFMTLAAAAVGDALLALTGTGELRRLDVAAGAHEPFLEGRAAVALGPADAGRAAVAFADGTVGVVDGAGQVVAERQTGLAQVTAVAAAGGIVAASDREAGAVAVLDSTLDGFAAPEGVAVSSDGVYVAETGAGRVTLLAHTTGERTVVAEGLPLDFPRPRPRGERRSPLAAAADGSLLVGCDGDGSVRRLRRT